MLLKDLSRSVNNHIVDFLWRQWSQLGVAGNIDNTDDWVIDPEALFIFSLNQSRYDARLFDEILDWINKNERWISLQRIKSLIKQYENRQINSIFTAVASSIDKHQNNVRWKSFAIIRHELQEEPESLFLNQEGIGLPLIGQSDVDFLSAGWIRSPVNLRGLSNQVKLNTPTNLILLLRSLFGLSPRAEIIAYLMSNDWANVSDMVNATGYSRPPIHESLNDLYAGGYIIQKNVKSRKVYSININRWKQFLGIEYKLFKWIDWQGVFTTIDKFCRFLETTHSEDLSEYLLKSKLISIAQTLNDGLVSSGLGNPFSYDFTLDNILLEFPKRVEKFFSGL
ncbi:MAG: winged helix-turn-helix domain-containing protein [Saccharofermentanales bacterium]